MTDSIKILLVDDHPLTRGGIRFALESQVDFQVVGEAGNGEEAVRLVAALGPDVVLMDLNMPVLNGVEATRQIHARFPRTNVIVFTAYSDDENVIEALRAGALSFVLKDARGDELYQAVRLAYQGNLFLDSTIASLLFQHINQAPLSGGPNPFSPVVESSATDSSSDANSSVYPGKGGAHRVLPGGESLTDRECEVLGLLGQGLANKEIAARLVISERTAKFHVSSIMSKLGATNRTEAVSLAAQYGLLNL